MLEVRLLGQFEVILDSRRLTIPTRNAQALFAYLILNAGKAYRREKLAGLLWPDSSEDSARSNLRHELWRLRKALEPDGQAYFRIDDLTIAFNSQVEHYLDARCLESVSAVSSQVDDLMEALSVYRGELLPGFYDEWVFVERSRLNSLYETRIARLLELLQAEARWVEVQDWAMRWIGLGQWPEPAYRALMSAYANTGNMSKAAATYESFSEGLQKDLGINPSEDTQRLYKRLKSGGRLEAGKLKPTPETLSTKVLGEGASAAYALPRVRRSNLPKPLTSFIGREKEIEHVSRLITRARVITITGAGGVGKTRLAIHAAESLTTHFKDGTCWVELAPLFKTSPIQKQGVYQTEGSSQKRDERASPAGEPGHLFDTELVILAVAKGLRVPESPGRTLLDGVLEYLHDKKLLLILDNCEHLIEECAVVVEYLLKDCPEVTILATSREALGVPGEKAWRLPSLSLSEPEVPEDASNKFYSEAVSLFIERAADVLTDYQPDETDTFAIRRVCQRLDGIPLAIELAAARMNMLSAQEIAARLDSRFNLLTGGHRTSLPRHQTLRAAIEWSYDLLSGAEQAFFRRLSIFTGSFTLEAAETICAGEEIHSNEVLTFLGRLVDKSLLNVEPAAPVSDLSTRYRFLDTICSYGRLKQDDAGETGRMRTRHADYYVHLAEAAEPELLLQNQTRWFKLIQAEYDNLYAVIEWGTENDQAENALRLVGALMWFWFSYGSAREGRDLALKALDSPSAILFKLARARALNTAGLFECLQGDTASARQSLDEALSILRDSDDEVNLAWSLQFSGLVYAYDKEYDLADAAFQEGLALTMKQEGVSANNFLHFLGDIDFQKGNRARAKKVYEESADLLRKIGNQSFLAYPLRRMGYLALDENELPTAWRYFRESLEINVEIGDKRAIAACLASLAALAIHLNKPIVAANLYGVVERRLDSLSVFLFSTDQTELTRFRSKLTGYLDEAAFTTAFTQGWEMNEEQAVELAQGIFESDKLL